MLKAIKQALGIKSADRKALEKLESALGSRTVPRHYSGEAEEGYERDWEFTGKFRETDATYLARIRQILKDEDLEMATAQARYAEMKATGELGAVIIGGQDVRPDVGSIEVTIPPIPTLTEEVPADPVTEPEAADVPVQEEKPKRGVA